MGQGFTALDPFGSFLQGVRARREDDLNEAELAAQVAEQRQRALDRQLDRALSISLEEGRQDFQAEQARIATENARLAAAVERRENRFDRRVDFERQSQRDDVRFDRELIVEGRRFDNQFRIAEFGAEQRAALQDDQQAFASSENELTDNRAEQRAVAAAQRQRDLLVFQDQLNDDNEVAAARRAVEVAETAQEFELAQIELRATEDRKLQELRNQGTLAVARERVDTTTGVAADQIARATGGAGAAAPTTNAAADQIARATGAAPPTQTNPLVQPTAQPVAPQRRASVNGASLGQAPATPEGQAAFDARNTPATDAQRFFRSGENTVNRAVAGALANNSPEFVNGGQVNAARFDSLLRNGGPNGATSQNVAAAKYIIARGGRVGRNRSEANQRAAVARAQQFLDRVNALPRTPGASQ